MKRGDLLDAQSAQLLGFEWLRTAVEPISPYGARRFAEIEPFRPGEESKAHERAQRIARIAAQLDADRLSAARGALRAMPDVAAALARAALGEVLDDPDFLELRRFCEAAAELDCTLAGCAFITGVGNDATRAVARELSPGRTPSAEFYLADSFDGELAAARVAAAQAQAELDNARDRERERAATALGREEIAGDEFVVMRADLRGTLPPNVRVVREAATYLLCAIEYGEATLTALERAESAATAIAAFEERVRTRLTHAIAVHASGLRESLESVAELDVALGAAAYAQRYDCRAAETSNEPHLSFRDGRFLPLEEELAPAGRHFVPIELDLRAPAVLTGPNMGGKSVALQTCGFIAMAAAFGLPVPASEARAGLFDQIAWLGLGREERLGGLLSSFAQELIALRTIAARNAPRLLIFVDEFARTTTPHEGKALVVALLALLRARKACGLVATHLHGIAAAAGVPHFAVRGLTRLPDAPATGDLADALARLGASMDYTIHEVSGAQDARADALALAALLGLDPDFVDAARRALSQ